MKDNSPRQSMQYEMLSPFWMVGCLILVSFLLSNRTTYTYHGMIVHSTQAHIFIMHLMWLIFWMYLYIHAWERICHKTYRILLWVAVFMISMFLGCHFIPWWNVWMSIPLTIIWYPFHRWILERLPRKELDSEGESPKESK